MKKFILLGIGNTNSTKETIDKWMQWFGEIKDHIVDSGNPFAGGMEVTASGIKQLPRDKDAITGYIIINAETMDEAVKLAQTSPSVSGMRVYEAMVM